MSPNNLQIHAIILALNEEIFIKAQLNTIYSFCSGISVITQYDRDWYGKPVVPDDTVNIALNYPDPAGKIHLLIRRLPDEAAARNMEMISFTSKSFEKIMSHGRSREDISSFHKAPDYFWIIDADEIYDESTIPAILKYLKERRPRGMRVTGYNYLRNWNRRVPRSEVDFTHFGFIKPGLLFTQRRVISWNEFRVAKLFKTLGMPDFSARLFGFIDCPESIGVFHHGCWLGDDGRIEQKFQKSSHQESHNRDPKSINSLKTIRVQRGLLPANIQNSQWPKSFFEDGE